MTSSTQEKNDLDRLTSHELEQLIKLVKHPQIKKMIEEVENEDKK